MGGLLLAGRRGLILVLCGGADCGCSATADVAAASALLPACGGGTSLPGIGGMFVLMRLPLVLLPLALADAVAVAGGVILRWCELAAAFGGEAAAAASACCFCGALILTVAQLWFQRHCWVPATRQQGEACSEGGSAAATVRSLDCVGSASSCARCAAHSDESSEQRGRNNPSPVCADLHHNQTQRAAGERGAQRHSGMKSAAQRRRHISAYRSRSVAARCPISSSLRLLSSFVSCCAHSAAPPRARFFLIFGPLQSGRGAAAAGVGGTVARRGSQCPLVRVCSSHVAPLSLP